MAAAPKRLAGSSKAVTAPGLNLFFARLRKQNIHCTAADFFPTAFVPPSIPLIFVLFQDQSLNFIVSIANMSGDKMEVEAAEQKMNSMEHSEQHYFKR